MGSSPHLCFFPCKTATLWADIQVCMGSQISSVVLSTHNHMLSTRIKRLYGFQPSSEVFAWKPAAFGPKLYVSMGPRTHPWFSACKRACLASEILVSMGFQPSRVVFGCKTATYGPEKQVSMGPRHDLSLCECKTAWFASDSLVSMCPNPHLCFFFMQYSAFWTRISSLYGFQTSSVVFSTHNCELNTRIKRTLLVPALTCGFVHAKQRLLDQSNKSLWVPDITCPCVHAIQRD